MVLPKDLLILALPSIPGTRGASGFRRAWGSGKVSPKRWLKRRAISRVSSMCCTWSSPTGTVSAL